LIFNASIHGAAARVDVMTDGRVRFTTAAFRIVKLIKAPTWISLDGIAFAEKGTAMAFKW